MAVISPKTLEEMSTVRGVGEFKLRKYGTRFLKIFLEEADKDEKLRETWRKNPIFKETEPEDTAEEMPEEEPSSAALFAQLKFYRNYLASKKGVPVNRIFTDDTLSEMARKRPETKEELRAIRGIDRRSPPNTETRSSILSSHHRRVRSKERDMSLADKEYLGIVKNILENGALGDNRTGMPAYKLPHQIMQFDLERNSRS